MDTADTVIESWLKREFFGLADGNRWTQIATVPQLLHATGLESVG